MLAEVIDRAIHRDHDKVCWPAVRHLIADIEDDPDYRLRERADRAVATLSGLLEMLPEADSNLYKSWPGFETLDRDLWQLRYALSLHPKPEESHVPMMRSSPFKPCPEYQSDLAVSHCQSDHEQELCLPWRIQFDGLCMGHQVSGVTNGGGWTLVATDLSHAQARLIANAPALLDAVQGLLGQHCTCRDKDGSGNCAEGLHDHEFANKVLRNIGVKPLE